MGKKKNKQQQKRQQPNSKKQGQTKSQAQEKSKKDFVSNVDNDEDFAFSEEVPVKEVIEEEEEIIEFITPGAKEHYKDFSGSEFNYRQFVPDHFRSYGDYDYDEDEDDYYEDGDYDGCGNDDCCDYGDSESDGPDADADGASRGQGRRLFGNFFNPFNFGINPDDFSEGDEDEDEYDFGSDIDSDEYTNSEAKDYIREMMRKIVRDQNLNQEEEEEEEEDSKKKKKKEEPQEAQKKQTSKSTGKPQKSKKEKKTAKKEKQKKTNDNANEPTKKNNKKENEGNSKTSNKKENEKDNNENEGNIKDEKVKKIEEENNNDDSDYGEFEERDECDPLMMQFFQAIEGGIRSCAEEANRIKPRDEDSACAFIASIDPNIISMGIGQILIPIIQDWKVSRATSFIYHNLSGGELEDFLGMLDVRYGYDANNKYRLSTVFGSDANEDEAKVTTEKLSAALQFYAKMQKLGAREIAWMLNTARKVWNEPIHSRLFCGVVSALTKSMSFMDGGLVLRLITDKGDCGASWTSDFQMCFALCTATWSEENRKALAQRIPGVLAGWPKEAITGAVDGINGVLPDEFTPYLPIQENIVSSTADNGEDDEDEGGDDDDEGDGEGCDPPESVDTSPKSKGGKTEHKRRDYDDIDDNDDNDEEEEDRGDDYDEDEEEWDDDGDYDDDDEDEYDEDDDINRFGYGGYGGFVNFGPGGRRDDDGYIDLGAILESAIRSGTTGKVFYGEDEDEDEEEVYEDDDDALGEGRGNYNARYSSSGNASASYDDIMAQLLGAIGQNIGSGNVIFENDSKQKASKPNASSSSSSSQPRNKNTKKGRNGNARKKH